MSHEEFEVEGELSVGDVIKAGEAFAIVLTHYHEESEFIRYAGQIEREKVEKFMPDLISGRRVARCMILRSDTAPRPGDEVRHVDDETLKKMHYMDGEFSMPYLIPLMKKCKDNLWVLRDYIKRLMEIVPEERDVLEIILAEIEYGMLRGVEI